MHTNRWTYQRGQHWRVWAFIAGFWTKSVRIGGAGGGRVLIWWEHDPMSMAESAANSLDWLRRWNVNKTGTICPKVSIMSRNEVTYLSVYNFGVESIDFHQIFSLQFIDLCKCAGRCLAGGETTKNYWLVLPRNNLKLEL